MTKTTIRPGTSRARSSKRPADAFVVLSANIEHDGGWLDQHGTPDLARSLEIAHLLAELDPDVLLRQEMTHSQLGRGDAHRHQVADILDSEVFVSPNQWGSNPNGMLVRHGTFGTVQQRGEADRPYRAGPWGTPPTIVYATFQEAPEHTLILGSVHASSNSPSVRRLEVEHLSREIDKVPRGAGLLVGGDWNESPLQEGEEVPAIDWQAPELTDDVHRRHRAERGLDGTWRSITYMDQYLLDTGLHDPARHVARAGKPDALRATAGRARPDQGGPQRIDRFALDRYLITAVEDVEVINMSGASDHDAVCLVLSRRGMIESLRRSVAPAPRWPACGETHRTVTGTAR
ncbi:endonuclease/exonuclease/phosphatase family protein [Streptomyces sp. NPDC007088]|uniref:endonuclease/exonuclease/phosphatase family protein n=1 Tax=Streptomyces sp. NPDC007088 TaxID=3364773 RepID=UPI0036B4932F